MTCDYCFLPLEDIGRHNRYYFSRILDFKKLSHREFNANFLYYRDWLNYDTSAFCRGGSVFCYKIEPLRQNSYSTWYCCKDCAIKESIRSNAILFYYDEYERSVAFFTPHIHEINRAINESEDTPLLMMEWSAENWFQHPEDYQDLRQYGFCNQYPVFETNKFKIVKPSAYLFEEYKKLVLQPDFQKDFWGANGIEISQHIKKEFPNWLKSVDIHFGRRLMIEWFITDKMNAFMGFIHLTCMYPAYPYKWVVEFGLKKEYRRRGIMKSVLNIIIEWAKENGCDEIYAISEDYNTATHRLINGLPYMIQESTKMMSDQFGGFRPMKNFIINLQQQSGEQRLAYFYDAVQFYRQKRYEESVKSFKQALAAPYQAGTPYTDAQIYSNMGMALSSLKRYYEAFQCLKKAQCLGLNNSSIEKELLWLKNNCNLS